MNMWIHILAYLLLAPLVGGLLVGIDRKLSARMQSRIGPPLWQPFADVLKLWGKESIVVRRSQNFYIHFFLIFMIFTGAMFFAGGDMLLMLFALTLACIFFVLGAYKASSPYSLIGAERELIQMVAYEPMLLLAAVGMYQVTGSFRADDAAMSSVPLIVKLPGMFLGLLFILEFKFRKSPFDLAASHHAHQELVRGILTEFSGRTLAMIEIAHWYEYTLLLGFMFIFFAAWPIVGVCVTLAVYFLLILTDNTFARVKWQPALVSAWIVSLVLGVGNMLVLSFLK